VQQSILLVQGANMEWLGHREPELYGTTTAAELDAWLFEEAKSRGVDLGIRYTNVEGEAISWIYDAARGDVDGILINPAGFLHSGFALRDCLRGVALPVVEVHVTNLERRKLHSVTAEAADGCVTGFGLESYLVGLDGLLRLLRRRD
jgi:3-dehydroquinate dehydratase II